VLVDSFNGMLARIEAQTADLEEASRLKDEFVTKVRPLRGANDVAYLRCRAAGEEGAPEVAIMTSVDLTIAMASSPRRSLSARTASAVITAVND
jgi:hypothetical protein